MTDWGAKRAYNISRVRMDMNPVNAKFNADGNSVTVKEYFREKYNIDLDPGQPLLEVGNRKDSILLPAQICFIESIPEALKKRKDIIAQFRKNPQEKLVSVQEVVDEIVENPELQEWGLTLSTVPYEFDTRILQKPYLVNGKESRVEIMGK